MCFKLEATTKLIMEEIVTFELAMRRLLRLPVVRTYKQRIRKMQMYTTRWAHSCLPNNE